MCNSQKVVARNEVSGSTKWYAGVKISFFFAIVVFTIFVLVSISKPAQLIAAEWTLENLNKNVSSGLPDSHLEALAMISDALSYGVVSVRIDYSDELNSISLDASLHSDETNREYMLTINIDVNGTEFDIRIFVNRYHIAASSSILGTGYYGITFKTFRDEFRPFAQLLGLTNAEFDRVVYIVNMISGFLNNPDEQKIMLEPYIELLRRFITDNELLVSQLFDKLVGFDVENMKIRGSYELDSYGGFTIRIDPIDLGMEKTLFFELSTEIGANIDHVYDFTSIRNMSLGTILNLILNFL